MLYRPNFCCHCGEKIARSKWLPWTSRRFCEFCQVEQMQHELLPKAAFIVALIVGAAGAVSYFGRPAVSETRTDARAQVQKLRSESNDKKTEPPSKEAKSVATPEQPSELTGNTGSTKLQRAAPRESSTEAVYYCGAMTRKGTRCMRRVKTPGRCWQHADQPVTQSEVKQTFRR